MLYFTQGFERQYVLHVAVYRVLLMSLSIDIKYSRAETAIYLYPVFNRV
jgi:hypothetical protein